MFGNGHTDSPGNSPGTLNKCCLIFFGLFLLVISETSFSQQMTITSIGSPKTQNFDSMGRAQFATLPTGFRIDTAGNWNGNNGGFPTTTTTRAGGTIGSGVLSSSSGGGQYNFCNGDTSISTDRALGFLNTGSYGGPRSIVLRIQNTTSTEIGSLSISFDYEKYRSGARDFNWYFYHGSSPTPSISQTSGDQNYPNDGATTTIYNPPATLTKTVVIGNISILPGAVYYLRWHLVGSSNATSTCSSARCTSGQGLGIDNLSITAYPGCTQPVTQGAITALLNVTQGEVQVRFNRGSGTGGAMIIASTSASLSSNPSSGNGYAPNTVFGSGTALGGGYVVFSGAAGGPSSTNNLVNITGLSNNTQYYFYLFDFDNPNYCYRQTPSTMSITTLPPPLTSTYKYRSKASGAWSNKNNWEVSADGVTNWVPADLPPDTTAAGITISLNDSIDIGSNVIADQVLVNGLLTQSAGIFRLFNGAGSDLIVSPTATFKIQTPTGAAYSNGVSLITTGALINVNAGGRITIGNGSAVGAGFENLALAASASVTWNNGSVFEWNTTTPFETEWVSYFPGVSAGTIPVFRVMKDFTLGSDSTSVWNGLFEAVGNVTFNLAGSKTFRNGIIGPGHLTQAAGCGVFWITGNPAQLGGSGSLILNTAGDTITTAANVTMISNKNIIGGQSRIAGTLNADTYQITGNGTTNILLSTTGTIKTANPNGFYGSSATTISNTVDSAKVNVKNGTVDYSGTGSQTITPYLYGNLFNSGNGPRIYSPLNEIRIFKSFSPGSGTPTITGSAINYCGAGQTLAGYTYNALLLSGSGTKVTDNNNIYILDSIRVYGSVSLTVGNVGNPDSVFLLSSATQTARFAKWEGNSLTVNEPSKFVAERYISTPRKWQLLAASTWNAVPQTFNQSWMEGNAAGGNQNPGYGTYITSNDPAWSTKGFDAFTPGGPSLKYYNPATGNYVAVDNVNAQVNIATTNSTGLSNFPKTAYFLYVRGDRSATPMNGVSNSTVLRTFGRPSYGNASTGGVIPAGSFYAAGNPYLSPILFRPVTKVNVSDAFYVWDPKLGGAYGVGSFRTCAWDGSNYVVTPWSPLDTTGSFPTGINNTIQSGQGFFVNNPTASAGQLVFSEASKVSAASTFNFRPGGNAGFQRLRVNIHGFAASGGPELLDGCMIEFSQSGNNRLDQEDIRKLMNMASSFGSVTDGIRLAVERRKDPVVRDTLFLFQSGFRARAYRMELNATNWNLTPRLTAYLVDRYADTRTVIQPGVMNFVDFRVDEKPASFATDRFYIVFGISKNSQKPQADISANPVTVRPEIQIGNLDVFPNPVTSDRVITVKFPQLKSGKGSLELIDANGKTVFSESVVFSSAYYSLSLPAGIPSGAYFLRLIAPGSSRIPEKTIVIP